MKTEYSVRRNANTIELLISGETIKCYRDDDYTCCDGCPAFDYQELNAKEGEEVSLTLHCIKRTIKMVKGPDDQ